MKKFCVICSQEFETNRGNKTSCSPACRKEYEKRYRQKYYHNYYRTEKGREIVLRAVKKYTRSDKYVSQVRKYHLQAIELLGGKCIACGCDDLRVLQIDHIEGGGNKELRQLGPRRLYKKIVEDPFRKERYQVLCANCNWIKRHENKEFANI